MSQQYPTDPAQQPYYQQAPAYPPMGAAPQPQKKKMNGCLLAGIIVGAVVIVLGLAFCGISAYIGGKAVTAVSTQVATDATQGTTSSAPATSGGQTYKVGQTATVGGWEVTVKSVKTSKGDDITTPKAGDVYLLVDVALVNKTGQSQTFSSLLAFTLSDQGGQKYDQTIVDGAPAGPDGQVANGAPTRGTIAFEVPASAKSFTLSVSPDLSDSVDFTLSV